MADTAVDTTTTEVTPKVARARSACRSKPRFSGFFCLPIGHALQVIWCERLFSGTQRQRKSNLQRFRSNDGEVKTDLKEKKEVAEEVEKVEQENGSGDAPANGTVSGIPFPLGPQAFVWCTLGAQKTNGADHGEETPEDEEDEEEEGEGEEGEGGEEDGAEEADGHPVKRPAEEEEKAETKKQKTENGDSTEAEVKA
ncbi:hypothetical protein JZ751_017509 [Albula glossodonta]|uniref:Uncharacterized protein n=1 Tax=Albula glossodonta TaxID=121402 RepID=A0A8T2PHX7_9TELE|nr:hypothetical protein JZ751_017509 [Albula glossodonta]